MSPKRNSLASPGCHTYTLLIDLREDQLLQNFVVPIPETVC